jgi:hypothetical protein
MSSVYSMLFALFGVVAVGLFHADIYFPIWLSVAILAFVSLYFLNGYLKNRVGILLLLLWLVYALPFIHIPPYMWFDFSHEPLRLWGMAVRPYMTDQRVIELTAMIGAVGAMGMAIGVSMSRKPIRRDLGLDADGSKRIFRTMALPIWLIWVVVGVVLTWLAAPQETIFTAAYTQSASVLDGAGFDSAWMMSYVILSFAFCDTLLERKRVIQSVKMKVILAAVLLVVVYFQLLRGDRAAVPWVFGLALVYYYWAAGITQRRGFTMPWLKVFGVAFCLVAVSMTLGAMRHSLTGASLSDALDLAIALNESGAIGLSNILHGTWSAVLLTPLSVAGDHVNHLLALKYGQDYLNFVLSIPPGFLADAVGYIRPIDSGQGPAWEMRYGIGGTHATVVPFMNFRMVGVFIVSAIWSFIVVKYEKFSLVKVTVINLSLLATIAMVAPQWLWYGEKYGFNAIVLWLIFSFLYRVSLGLSRSMSTQDRLSLRHGVDADAKS